MPSVKQCGKNGQVYFTEGGGLDLHVHAWTITEEQGLLDVTDFNSGDCEEFILCRKRWSGSFEFYMDRDEAETIPAAPAAATFLASNERQFQGDILISSITWSVDKSEANKGTANFTGSGCMTKGDAGSPVPSPSDGDFGTPGGS